MKRLIKLDPLVAGTIFSILTAFFVMLFLFPQIRTYALLSADIAEAENLIKFKEARLAQAAAYTLEIEVLESELDFKKTMLPVFERLTENVVYINALMSNCGIAEMEFTISEPSAYDALRGLHKVTVKLRGIGKYNDVMQFLQLLNEAGTLYVIENASLTSVGIVTNDEVELYMRVSLYVIEQEIVHSELEGLIYEGANPFYYEH